MGRYDGQLHKLPIADYVRFLRDQLDDPKGNDRNSNDAFVFWNSVGLEIGHDAHEPPFVLVKPADQNSSPVGNWANGDGSDDNLTFTVRVVGGSLGDVKDLISQAQALTKNETDATGTDSYNGEDYDMTELTPQDISNAQDRSSYREDNYKELVFDVQFQTYTGFN